MRRLLALVLLFALLVVVGPARAIIENNDGTILGALKSRAFRQDSEIWADASRGNGVVSGCLVTAGTGLTYTVASGVVQREGVLISVAAVANQSMTAADSTHARIDLVTVDDTGAVIYTAGTPASTPRPPAIPQVGGINNVVLAALYVTPGLSSMAAGNLVDKRVIVNQIALQDTGVVPDTYQDVTVDSKGRVTAGVKRPEVWPTATSDVSSSSTTLVPVTGLTTAVCATSSDLYQWEAQLFTSASDTTADFKFGLSLPAGATANWAPHLGGFAVGGSYFDPVATTSNQVALLTESSQPTYGSAAVTGGFFFRGWIICGATPGNFAFQFARAGASGTVTIKKGSWLVLRKLPTTSCLAQLPIDFSGGTELADCFRTIYKAGVWDRRPNVFMGPGGLDPGEQKPPLTGHPAVTMDFTVAPNTGALTVYDPAPPGSAQFGDGTYCTDVIATEVQGVKCGGVAVLVTEGASQSGGACSPALDGGAFTYAGCDGKGTDTAYLSRLNTCTGVHTQLAETDLNAAIDVYGGTIPPANCDHNRGQPDWHMYCQWYRVCLNVATNLNGTVTLTGTVHLHGTGDIADPTRNDPNDPTLTLIGTTTWTGARPANIGTTGLYGLWGQSKVGSGSVVQIGVTNMQYTP